MLSSAATEMNLMKVVFELGQARDMGSYPDPLSDVPEVRPVLRPKVCDSIFILFFQTTHRSFYRYNAKLLATRP
jgi:hypothetical protein